MNLSRAVLAAILALAMATAGPAQARRLRLWHHAAAIQVGGNLDLSVPGNINLNVIL